MNGIIHYFYEQYRGENNLKLYNRIKIHYAGISKEAIQAWINSNARHCEQNPVFKNKDMLKPVNAKAPMEKVQIDLVVFETNPSYGKDGTCYKYVLSVLDIFSRFLFLYPLESKKAEPVMDHLTDVFLKFGYPKSVQSDQGNEFKGYFLLDFDKFLNLTLLLIYFFSSVTYLMGTNFRGTYFRG